MGGIRRQARPAEDIPLDGMRRDFPPSSDGVDAPRLVVFEVINLKLIERGSPWSRLHEASVWTPGRSVVRVGADLAKRVHSGSRGRCCKGRWCAAVRCVVTPSWLVRPAARQAAWSPWRSAPAPTTGRGGWRRMGLQPRLMSAQLVKPYRSEGATGKNDANDAAAICEAASRPTMRFVPVKSVEQQSHAVRAPAARRLKGRSHRVHQPDPRAAGGVRPGLRAGPRGAAARCWPTCSRTRANEMNALARLVIEHARRRSGASSMRTSPGATSAIAQHAETTPTVRQARTADGHRSGRCQRGQWPRWMTSRSSRTALSSAPGAASRRASDSSGGKTQARAHHAPRRRLPAQPAGARCQIGGADRAQEDRSDLALGAGAARTLGLAGRLRWRWPTRTRASSGR